MRNRLITYHSMHLKVWFENSLIKHSVCHLYAYDGLDAEEKTAKKAKKKKKEISDLTYLTF